MREKPNISDKLLQTCLQQEYGFSTAILEFLPLGLDTQAGVYRVENEQGLSYLLKAKAGLVYEPRYFIPRYLADQGITAVVAPLPTKNKALWVQREAWNIVMYPFVEGVTGWQPPLSAENWQSVGLALKQIHRAIVPPEGFSSVRQETFDPTHYADWIHTFEAQQTNHLANSPNERTLRVNWRGQQLIIQQLLTSMEKMAKVLRERTGSFVICHADLHPGNLIRNQAGQVFIIDWDEVMLALKERDFIFINEGDAGDFGLSQPSPFFQGYGETVIDWVALTYYRYERVIQDVIACAQDVFFRNDLEEETKAEAVSLFVDIFSKGGELETAFATTTHLPSDLDLL